MLAILVAVLVVGFFLPKSYRVERSTVINAPAKDVYPHISSFRKWQDWIAWNTAKFPDMTVTFGAQDSGVGASYSWTGKSSGNGAIKFTKVEPDQGIEYRLDFENGKYISNDNITLALEGNGVRGRRIAFGKASAFSPPRSTSRRPRIPNPRYGGVHLRASSAGEPSLPSHLPAPPALPRLLPQATVPSWKPLQRCPSSPSSYTSQVNPPA